MAWPEGSATSVSEEWRPTGCATGGLLLPMRGNPLATPPVPSRRPGCTGTRRLSPESGKGLARESSHF